MDIEIKMPDLATTSEEVTIIRWMIEVGQPVGLGQPLLEIETDKAAMEVESIAAGVLKAIYVEAGNPAAVGQVIAMIEKVGTTVQSAAPLVSTPTTKIEAAPVTPQVKKEGSLFARNKLARESKATAPNEIALNPTHRELARRLQESKQTIPHYYLNTSANAERIVASHNDLLNRTPTQKIVWDAFFVVAAAKALKEYDRLTHRFEKDRLVRRNTDAIGVAADIDGELYVIAVDDPLSQSPEQVSAQITSKLERIRAGDPAAKKLTETCITITNLGAEGIESFMAIINPPESAILAIGKIAPTVQPDGDQVVIQKRVSLSLSVDHRIANGKYAAAFLGRIVKELESF